MQYSYMERVKACVRSALRDFPRTFEETVQKCYGAYPLLVRQAMDELKIHSYLVPLYSTQEESIPYMSEAEIDYRKSDLVTYKVENNPVLSNWYFSWHSCQKLSQLDLWQGKNILFLGTPRLFEYFIIHDKGESLTLIDLDRNVTDALREKYESKGIARILTEDINFLEPGEERYDVVFLDPPWYIESYISWLAKATKLVTPKGAIIFTLFPYLLRPTASGERDRIYKLCRKLSKSLFTIPEYLEYDIPSFEKKELRQAGVVLRSNWKMSDLVILQDITHLAGEWDHVSVNTEYRNWTEFNLFGIRWFIHSQSVDKGGSNPAPLLSLLGDSPYLKSPSRRNKQFLKANLLSSQGHGLVVSEPKKFLDVVDAIRLTPPPSLETAVSHLEIDEGSKKIIMMLRDD